MLLGAIADDFTGATDLASMLVRGGMRTVQLIGVPRPDEPAPDADAVVVALKSRTAPVKRAVKDSLAALAWLRHVGCSSSSSDTVSRSTVQTRATSVRWPTRRSRRLAVASRLLVRRPSERAQHVPGSSVRRQHAAEPRAAWSTIR